MGFPYGADEDAAYMVTWLELYKFEGIKQLAKLSKKIDKKYNARINVDEIKSSAIIDLFNSCLLMKGPGLFDYFYQNTIKNKNLEVTLTNCIDPIFIIPLTQKFSEKFEYVSAIWKSNQNKKMGIKIIGNNSTIGELKNNIEIFNKQILLQFSTNKKSTKIKKLSFFKVKHKINKIIEQKNLNESLNPKTKDWKIISKLANRTFVPESEVSRKKGAGGGDDND